MIYDGELLPLFC